MFVNTIMVTYDKHNVKTEEAVSFNVESVAIVAINHNQQSDAKSDIIFTSPHVNNLHVVDEYDELIKKMNI